MTPAATQRRPDRDRFAAGGTNQMTDFDYGLAGRRTAWPVASPAEMFWPDILSPVSHLEGDREFADSPLEGAGFEPSVPRDTTPRTEKWARKENRNHEDAGCLQRDRWFESDSLQRRVMQTDVAQQITGSEEGEHAGKSDAGVG